MVNREPQTEGPTERIQPSEWRGLEVDLMTDADGCRYFVEVSENDFRHWLDQQQSPTGATGKKPLIIRHLAKMFSNQRVPEPAFCNRKKLLNDLIKLESGFGGKLDEQTLKTAVDEYNRSIRTNPNRTASD
jgi:hypothetical protein